MKILIALGFVAIAGALAAALYFMARVRGTGEPADARQRSRRMAQSLALRVALSIALFLGILLAYRLGYLQPTGWR